MNAAKKVVVQGATFICSVKREGRRRCVRLYASHRDAPFHRGGARTKPRTGTRTLSCFKGIAPSQGVLRWEGGRRAGIS